MRPIDGADATGGPGDGHGDGHGGARGSTRRNGSAGRSIRWENVSHALLPEAVRSRAVAVAVRTDKGSYARDEPVRFEARFVNRLPLPVVLRTASPVRWTWDIDGLPRASRLPRRPPDEPALFRFSRGETKRFSRTWYQRVRVSEREWAAADPGEHTLAVGVNAERGADRLRDAATFRIEDRTRDGQQ